MSTEITINQDIVEINVTEEVVVIEAPSGAYPLPSMVSSVFGRTGNVVAQEGDYTLTQLGDVTISTPSNGQVLRYNGTTWVNATESFAGTVTSVDMSVPTGLTISGNPITTSGTLAVGLGAGYVIPTQAALDAKQDDLNGTGIVKSTAGTITYLSDNTANWNTAYNDSIVSASVTGTATKTLTLNQQDGGSVTASWTDTDTGLTSVGLSMPSAFSVANSPLTANGTLSVTGAGTTAQYVRGDGSLAIFPSLTGFVPYTGATTNVNLGTHSLTAADLVINHVSGSGVAASITKGGSGEALTVIKTSGSGNAASITGGVTLLDELHLTTDLADAYIASAATWNAKQNAITLTTTGTSGAATLVGATLNIPQYQGVLTNPVTGTGTTNTLPKFTGASTIGNSNITDTGSLITLGSNSLINGNVGIGSTPTTTIGLLLSRNITGAVTSYGTYSNGSIQSDVTTTATYHATFIGTAAASFTVNNAYGHYVAQTTIGAGSAISTQQAFYAHSNFTGATNNYGFRGAIPSGTNRWNLFMDGTANNYLNGSLGIGTTSLTGINFYINKNITGSTNGGNLYSTGTIQSDMTGNVNMVYSAAAIAAGAFTISNLWHYNSDQLSIGAGAAITTQVGFRANNTLVGAGTNYGFQGRIPAGTNRWNLFMDGTAANYLAGVLNIGTSTLSGFTLDVNGTARISNALTLNGAYTNTSDVGLILTANIPAINLRTAASVGRFTIASNYSNTNRTSFIVGTDASNPSTEALFIEHSTGAATFTRSVTAASFIPTSSTIPTNGMYLSGTNTLGFATNGTLDMVLNEAGNLSIGTATIPYGEKLFIQGDASASSATLTTSANSGISTLSVNIDRGLQGGINIVADKTNQIGRIQVTNSSLWPLVFQVRGTDGINERMRIDSNGSVGIGTTSLTGFSLRVAKNITGATSGIGISQGGIIQSDVTSGWGYYNSLSTAAATFTIGTYRHYFTEQGTLGAGSVITIQTGFEASSSLIGGTNNYGFRGAIPAGTNRWNLFMDGTAANYMAGKLLLGSTTDSGQQFQVNGTSLFQNAAVGIIGTFRSATANGQRLDVSSTATGIRLTSGFDTGITGTFEIFTAGGFSALILGTQSTERMRINSVGVGIGATSINASARLQVDSTTQGFLPPRMTTTEKLAIGTPAAGLMVYDTTLNQMSYFNGTLWINF